MRALLLAVFVLAGCTAAPPAREPPGTEPAVARCDADDLWGPASDPGRLEQPVHEPLDEVGGWRVRFEPAELAGAPGERVRFAVVVQPSDPGQRWTNLTAGPWVRFAGNATTVAVSPAGGIFPAEMLLGADRQSTFRFHAPHHYDEAFPGPVGRPGAGRGVEARSVEREAELPEGLCATVAGGRLHAAFTLPTRTIDCGLGAAPVGNATLRDGTLHAFVAWGQGDVCHEHAPFTARAAFRTEPLPPGTYRVVLASNGTWKGTPHHAPPGWEQHEAVVTVP